MNWKRLALAGSAAALVAVVSACTTAPPPPPAPPPVVRTFPRPYPPMGAATNLVIPPRSVDGSRLTINSNLSPEQAVWNLRSAYNVAALNCMLPKYSSLIPDYGSFLKTHQKALRDVNRTLDAKFKAEHGRTFIADREMFQTQVYNYFALPPTIPQFCDAALVMSQNLKLVPPGELQIRAPAALASLEAVFTDFFDRYEKYRVDFVQWQIDYTAKYGTPPAAGYFLPGEARYQPQQMPAVSVAAPGA